MKAYLIISYYKFYNVGLPVKIKRKMNLKLKVQIIEVIFRIEGVSCSSKKRPQCEIYILSKARFN